MIHPKANIFLIVCIGLFQLNPIIDLYSQESFNSKLIEARSLDENRLLQINRIKTVLPELQESNHLDTIGFANYFIAYRYTLLGDFENAIKYSKTALAFFKKAKYQGIRKARCINYIIDSYNMLGQYSKSNNFFYKNYSRDYYKDVKNDEAVLIRSVSENHKRLADYESALIILNTYLSSINKSKISESLLANIYLEKSIVESNLGQTQAAINSLDYAKKLEKSNPIKNSSRKSFFINREALILNELGKSVSALELYTEFLEEINNDTLALATIHINISDILFNSKRYEAAIKNSKASVHYTQFLADDYTELKYLALDNTACIYMEQEKIDSANYTLNKAFSLLDFDLKSEQVFQFEKSDNKPFLLNLLYDRARIYLKSYKIYQNKEALTNSIESLKTCDNLVDYYLNDLFKDGSIINLKSELSKYFELAIDISFLSNSLKDAIYFAERNRNLKIPSLNENTLTKVEHLKSEAFEFEYTLSINENDSIRNKLNKLNAEILNIYKQEKKLANLSQNTETEVNKFIVSDRTTILYQFGIDSLYRITLNKNKQSFESIGEKGKIIELATQYYSQIKNGRNSIFDKRLSESLYQILLGNIDLTYDNIIFIPDNELSFIPFETLIDGNGKYLLETKNISYATSLSNSINAQKRVFSENYLVAPTYSSSKDNIDSTTSRSAIGHLSFPHLQFVDNEVSTISNTININVLSDALVSKKNTTSAINNADLFHFAGHAFVNNYNENLSFLALNESNQELDDILSINEIKNLEKSPEFVILNACNTGAGKIIQGQGVFNIAKAFFDAGSKTVLSSLWEIDDKSTSEISTKFYANLKDGQNKASALRNAKLDYLSTIKSDNYAHPYYWAAPIIVGNPDAVSFSHTLYVYLLTVTVIIFALLITFKQKTKSPSKV